MDVKVEHDHEGELEEHLPENQNDEVKQTYKSYKKKYRKMRMKFDEVMRQSDELYVEEQLAIETAKRLAQENDRLLDLLLDMNNSAQMPEDKRIDLGIGTPELSAVPGLITSEELLRAAEFNSPACRAIYNEIRSMMEERASIKPSTKPTKSLASLMASTPHLRLGSPLVSPDLLSTLESPEGLSAPIQYLTLEQIDDYLYDIDSSLGTVPPPTQPPSPPTPQDLAIKNPHSVYNWLRRNEPKIFLQDGEVTEKTLGKPGALRGAGKRASIPAPSKPDALEFVEEDGIGYEVSLSGPATAKGGKRKRGGEGEDDGGYTPKSGRVDNPKPKKARKSKKGSEGGSTETVASTGSARKGKGKAKASSPVVEEPPSLLGAV